MSFPHHRRELVDSVFDTLGERARWGVGGPIVSVRRASSDDEEMMGELSIISRGERLKVRSWEIAAPKRGDVVEMVDDADVPTGEVLTVSGEAKRSRNGVWTMPFVTDED